VAYLSLQFGFLPGLSFGFYSLKDKHLNSQASLPPRALRPPFYSDQKGGDKILCNPPHSQPKSSPDKPLRKKIRVLTYLLSEHKFLFLWPKALQSYPNFASNLNFLFNRGSPVFLLTPILTPSKFLSSPILLAFCYSIGIKNLIRGMQNDRIGILPVEPDNLPAYGVGGGGDFCVYKANWRESKAVP